MKQSKATPRRSFLAGLLAAALMTAFPPAARSAETEKKPPNFIVIMADDLGAKELG